LDWKENTSVLEINLIFALAIIMGLSIGLILWYFKYKPLRDDALSLLSEIES
jgi:hypothetical protein